LAVISFYSSSALSVVSASLMVIFGINDEFTGTDYGMSGVKVMDGEIGHVLIQI
jgi:hypothetical protein